MAEINNERVPSRRDSAGFEAQTKQTKPPLLARYNFEWKLKWTRVSGRHQEKWRQVAFASSCAPSCQASGRKKEHTWVENMSYAEITEIVSRSPWISQGGYLLLFDNGTSSLDYCSLWIRKLGFSSKPRSRPITTIWECAWLILIWGFELRSQVYQSARHHDNENGHWALDPTKQIWSIMSVGLRLLDASSTFFLPWSVGGLKRAPYRTITRGPVQESLSVPEHSGRLPGRSPWPIPFGQAKSRADDDGYLYSWWLSSLGLVGRVHQNPACRRIVLWGRLMAKCAVDRMSQKLDTFFSPSSSSAVKHAHREPLRCM
jgi:hypothetical protein